MEYFFKKRQTFGGLKNLIWALAATFVIAFGLREYSHMQAYKELGKRAFALDPKSGFILRMSQLKYTFEERLVEYKSHVRDFLIHFYQFDQHTFIENMNYSSNLMGRKSFERELAKYKEANTHVELQERDVIITVIVDDISVDGRERPVTGSFRLTQTLRTDKYSTKRVIEGVFQMEDTEGRTFENPHAATIKNFEITRKEIIQ